MNQIWLEKTMLKIFKDINVIFLASILIVASYSPLIIFDFLYGDDYAYIFPKIGVSDGYSFLSSLEDFLGYFNKLGRPITGYIIWIQNYFISSIGDAKFFRYFSLLQILLIFYLFYSYFLKKKFNIAESFIISLSVVSIPAFNLSVAWLTLQTSLFSIIFSILSYNLLNKYFSKYEKKKYFYINLSIIFLLFSFLLYPPASTFFFIFYFLDFFLRINEKEKINLLILDKKIFLIPFTFISVLILNFLMIKFYFGSTGSIELNQVKKAIWFFTDIVPISVSFFLPIKSYIIVVIFFVPLYFFIKKYIEIKKFGQNSFLQVLLLLMCVLLISGFIFFPLLLASGYFTSSFRIIITVSSFFLIVFILFSKYALNENIYKPFLFSILLLSLISTFYQTYFYIAKPSSKEFSDLKELISKSINRDTTHIHIYRPSVTNSSLKAFDESDYGTYSSSVSTSTNNIAYLAIQENGIDPGKFKISSSVKTPIHEYDHIGDQIPNVKYLKIINFSDPNNLSIK